MSETPTLIEHLQKLVECGNEKVPFWPSLAEEPWIGLINESLIGLIIQETPTPEQATELLRVLKPGGHLMMISQDETGWKDAVVAEDAGFEIRDALLVMDDPARMFHVPKASRSEREAGCYGLPARNREQFKDGLEEDEAETIQEDPIEDDSGAAHNFHATVKPIGIMTAVLQNVPIGTVLDPFLGSGTTALACLRTGHDLIGIERDPDYLRIADARARHHNEVSVGWLRAAIQSEAPAIEKPEKEITFGEGW